MVTGATTGGGRAVSCEARAPADVHGLLASHIQQVQVGRQYGGAWNIPGDVASGHKTINGFKVKFAGLFSYEQKLEKSFTCVLPKLRRSRKSLVGYMYT